MNNNDYDANKPEEAGSVASDFIPETKIEETGVNEGGFICPNCGSTNTHKWAEFDGADDYRWECWCDDCKESITP